MASIEQYLSELNSQQNAVALHKGHCLAIAAPGSGKTKTLAIKAAYLLSQGATVGAVTFTRDAALELRERILHIAGQQCLPYLVVGTFHSIDLLMAFPSKAKKTGMGAEILRRGFSKLSRPWEIVREGNRRGFVMRAIEHSNLDLTIEEATAIIEGIKSGQVAPESEQHEALASMYKNILDRNGVIDFQDILLKTNELIAAEKISPLHCDYLLLDEYQDTDLPQFQWAMHHANTSSILTAVGDDDQSIYGFRRALGFKGMMDFANALSAEKIVLGTNYRSHAEVLTPAAKLIAVNENRMDKALVSHKGRGGLALWDRYGDRIIEAEHCCERAKRALAAGQSFGVLARTNKRLDAIEAECIKHRLPYTRNEGGSLLQSHEMAVFLSSLSAMLRLNNQDADSLLAWCGVSEQELIDLHSSIGKDLISKKTENNKILANITTVSDQSKKNLRAIQRRFEEWGLMLSSGAVTYVVEKLHQLLSEHTTDKRSKSTLELVAQVFSKSVATSAAVEDAGLEGMNQMLARVKRIQAMIAGPEKEKKIEGNPVALMTAHGSKGLEYDVVWILGAEDGSWPDEGSSMQEERRLFYVAMTRARKVLLISAAGKPPMSPFVSEADIERAPEVPGLLMGAS
ncbi:ATP-dependent helicase [Giesbergeria anulus]|uniref:DNA 3'-5' helicase n=1 Tax=Giesbergeria anulus TaxID=180197 RepID=A0A1H9NTU7_9BURK|nr:ATP-dependent helicase [Giesbergeria anulus]SER39464.1 Superfamily I DNA or RNA helicase [Giesbergeria anulus]